jgi:2-oxo-4-hydroxy-4-carboxy--5-ureidoimidazoline (OHCU) decarboxylase
MTRLEIIRMAQGAGFMEAGHPMNPWSAHTDQIEAFAALVAAHEREKVAKWMVERSYATGHGDTVEDLLTEIDWQVAEREREECAKVCDVLATHPEYASQVTKLAAMAIRARGEK